MHQEDESAWDEILFQKLATSKPPPHVRHVKREFLRRGKSQAPVSNGAEDAESGSSAAKNVAEKKDRTPQITGSPKSRRLSTETRRTFDKLAMPAVEENAASNNKSLGTRRFACVQGANGDSRVSVAMREIIFCGDLGSGVLKPSSMKTKTFEARSARLAPQEQHAQEQSGNRPSMTDAFDEGDAVVLDMVRQGKLKLGGQSARPVTEEGAFLKLLRKSRRIPATMLRHVFQRARKLYADLYLKDSEQEERRLPLSFGKTRRRALLQKRCHPLERFRRAAEIIIRASKAVRLQQHFIGITDKAATLAQWRKAQKVKAVSLLRRNAVFKWGAANQECPLQEDWSFLEDWPSLAMSDNLDDVGKLLSNASDRTVGRLKSNTSDRAGEDFMTFRQDLSNQSVDILGDAPDPSSIVDGEQVLRSVLVQTQAHNEQLLHSLDGMLRQHERDHSAQGGERLTRNPKKRPAWALQAHQAIAHIFAAQREAVDTESRVLAGGAGTPTDGSGMSNSEVADVFKNLQARIRAAISSMNKVKSTVDAAKKEQSVSGGQADAPSDASAELDMLGIQRRMSSLLGIPAGYGAGSNVALESGCHGGSFAERGGLNELDAESASGGGGAAEREEGEGLVTLTPKSQHLGDLEHWWAHTCRFRNAHWVHLEEEGSSQISAHMWMARAPWGQPYYYDSSTTLSTWSPPDKMSFAPRPKSIGSGGFWIPAAAQTAKRAERDRWAFAKITASHPVDPPPSHRLPSWAVCTAENVPPPRLPPPGPTAPPTSRAAPHASIAATPADGRDSTNAALASLSMARGRRTPVNPVVKPGRRPATSSDRFEEVDVGIAKAASNSTMERGAPMEIAPEVIPLLVQRESPRPPSAVRSDFAYRL